MKILNLKDKLIHMLGGLTEEDMMIRIRPFPVSVSRFSIRTVKICQILRPDMMKLYEDYINVTKKDMAYCLADKMLDECLIEFSSAQENPERTVMTALAKVVVPTEVSE